MMRCDHLSYQAIILYDRRYRPFDSTTVPASLYISIEVLDSRRYACLACNFIRPGRVKSEEITLASGLLSKRRIVKRKFALEITRGMETVS
jgi:hypothetical protein